LARSTSCSLRGVMPSRRLRPLRCRNVDAGIGLADMVLSESMSGSRLDADTVVIGAGPAGCSAALALAAQGASVLLAEQDKPGKEKPCGDAYIPAAIDLAQQLGLSMDAFGQCGRPFSGIDLLQSGRLIWRSDLCGETGWIARRAVVDQAL